MARIKTGSPPPTPPSKGKDGGGGGAPSSSSSSSAARGRPRKVGMACIYCRRSHMTCDAGRPCKRCIKRDIGHLCHDEAPTKPNASGSKAAARRSSVNSGSAMSASPSSAHAHLASSSPAARARVSLPPSAIMDILGGSGNATAANTAMLNDLSAMQAAQPQQRPQQQYQHPGLQGHLQQPGAHNPNTLQSTFRMPIQPDVLSSMLSAPSPNWAASMLGGASFLGLGGGEMGGTGNEFAASGDAAGGNEYNILSEFLESLDGTSALPTPAAPTTVDSTQMTNNAATTDWSMAAAPPTGVSHTTPKPAIQATNGSSSSTESSGTGTQAVQALAARNATRRASIAETSGLAATSSKTETFFLTAADQNDGTRDERLGKVIQAKLDAGLLRPYNHVKGYARLNQWMEQNCSQASRRRILKPLSIFRPAFRAVAQRLTNVDLIFIEEAFERLLLDYDRVFSTQGIPACLWRRTGEIYKGNKEFADLVGVDFDALREGRSTIYELMQEESAVNYWEKYGAVCFDPGQKAVLTSCVLKTNNHKKRVAGGGVGGGGGGGGASAPRSGFATPATPVTNRTSNAVTPAAVEAAGVTTALEVASQSKGNNTGKGKKGGGGATTPGPTPTSAAMTLSKSDTAAAASTNGNAPSTVAGPTAEDDYQSCCFSFTIRRDAWGIPYAIVGNFLPLER